MQQRVDGPRAVAAAGGERLTMKGRPESFRLALFTDTFPPQINGVARTLDRLGDAVRARGGELRVFTTSDPRASRDDPRGPASVVRRLPSTPFWAYPELRLAAPWSRAVRDELAEWRPTLIHVATPFGVGLVGRKAARELGVPLVTSYHTSFSAYAQYYGLGALSGTGWAYLRWFHNAGRRTYCPTRAIQSELAEHGFHNTAVWGRGVDTTLFSPAYRSPEERARLGAADESTVLAIYVGRLASEKGLDVALEAMHSLVRRPCARHVRFALAGDGPYEAHCRRNAPKGTTFVGRLTGRALSTFYASGDVFIFPSTTDTFGNVMLEAMASGLPVLAADTPQAREVVGPDRGMLFPPGDAGGLAGSVLGLAHAPEYRASLSRSALGFARRTGWDDVFDALLGDYQAVVEEHA